MQLRNPFERIWGKHFFLVCLVIWSLLIAASLTWNMFINHRETMERARVEARTIFQHNLAYRRWNALRGGVYAKVSEDNRPNPYIVIPERDFSTTDGIQMTLINPYNMTRQAYELLRKQSDLAAINRTVSLKPLNPGNEPDEWERNALRAFEQGKEEVSEVTEINEVPYLRLLRPYVTERGCLRCHGHQGYKEGDIRGGMSISVPMQPYLDAESYQQRSIIMSHMLIWFLGTVLTVLFSNGLRRYKKAITESESKFRIVSEFAHNFEFWIKEDGQIVYISPSCERITGYCPQEFIDNPQLLIDIVHPDDRYACRNHLADFRDSFHEDIEFRIITKDNRLRWVSHTCSPIFVQGEFLGRRGSNKDVTDKKKLEEQLFQARKMESLGQFAGGVAHDFNSLLSAINGFAFLLHKDLKEKGIPSADFAKQILVASKLGKNLTSNLLSFGRKQAIKLVPTKLSAVIIDISEIVRTLVGDEIDLKITLCDAEFPVLVDLHRVEQVIINLCTNAKDAMPAGGMLSMETSFDLVGREYPGTGVDIPPGSYMVLSVSDTGSGIDPEYVARIFEPFFTTKDPDRGTGLGLAIVHDIVMRHGGFIRVFSEKDAGTTFRVFFPTCDDTVKEALEPSSEVRSYGHETILVAEDEVLHRQYLDLLLQRNGYSVILAENGEDAVRKYSEHRDSIDMLILDVVMPEKNGKEVYEAIRLIDPDIKVLFMSGYTDGILTSNERLNFIAKPLAVKSFFEKVREVLHRRRQ